MKNVVALIVCTILLFSLCACTTPKQLVLITAQTQVMDESFNQLSWQGMTSLSDIANISYLETLPGTTIDQNLAHALNSKPNLIWVTDGMCADKVSQLAKENPNISFVVTDAKFNILQENLTGVSFHTIEASFLAGYIAAKTSKSGIIGFVGGQDTPVIRDFESGYTQGAKYAKPGISILSKYSNTFSDKSIGNKLAKEQYTKGADVIFQAAGRCGLGVIEAAVYVNKWVIGVDLDQHYLAPKNMLTSVTKKVDVAIKDIAVEFITGKKIGGRNIELGLKNDSVGIAENHGNINATLYNEVMTIRDKIISGEIKIKHT